MLQCNRVGKFSEVNTVFRLFQVNAVILVLSSVLTAIKQHFGTPLDCMYDGLLEQEKDFVNDYCWRNYEPILLQAGLHTATNTDVDNDSKVFRNVLRKKQSSLYRWLPLVLLLQALLANAPSWMWNSYKNRRIQETVASIKDSQKQPNRRKLLIINLASDLFSEAIHRRYAKPFFLCEIMNVLCLGLNVLCTNLMFHNQFIAYGINEIGMRLNRSATSGKDIFPQFGKCSIRIGVSKTKEAVCVIPYNSLCENIFMFLWVWFVALLFVSVPGFVYRLFIILSRRKRRKLLMEALDKTFEEKISKICDKLGFYAWFTLHRISRNVDPLTFQDIIASLMIRLESFPVYKSCKNVPKLQIQEPHHPSVQSHDMTIGVQTIV